MSVQARDRLFCKSHGTRRKRMVLPRSNVHSTNTTTTLWGRVPRASGQSTTAVTLPRHWGGNILAVVDLYLALPRMVPHPSTTFAHSIHYHAPAASRMVPQFGTRMQVRCNAARQHTPSCRGATKGQRPVRVMIPALIAFLGPVPQAITGRTECVAYICALNDFGGNRCQFRHGTGYSASPTAPDVNEWSYPEATHTAQTPQQPSGGGSHERAAKARGAEGYPAPLPRW